MMKNNSTSTRYNEFLSSLGRRSYLLPILLAATTILVYSPVFWNNFLYQWDDQWMVMNYFTEAGWTWNNLWRIFSEFYHGQYSPVNELLYVLVYSIFGYSPLAFHSACLLLHVANVCMVFLCCRKLLKMNGKVMEEQITAISFIATLLFAVHPMNVESIAWISASKVLVYAFFYLLATYSCLQYLERKKIGYYMLAVFLFVLSLGGKDQAVTFPLWMLLIYWIAGHDFKDKKLWMQVAPFFLLSLAGGLLTTLVQTNSLNLFDRDGAYPLWQRLIYACYSLTEYLVKIFVPVKLSYLYPFPSQPGEAIPSWLLVYPAMVLIISMSFWNFIIRHKPILFGLLFFAIHIALALHIVSLPRFAVVADRYVYLASTGTAFVVAYYAVRLTKRYKVIVITALTVYILYLGAYANIRTKVWHDTDTIKKELRELLKERNDYQEVTKGF
jgi:hypothetical protein